MRSPAILSVTYCVLIGIAGARGAGADGPPSIASALLKMGILLDHRSLCTALRDPRAAVRSLAATELAEQKDRAAVPLIVMALEHEKDANAEYGLASSLAAFHEEAGIKKLEHFCTQAAFDVGVRTGAANLLASIHNYACASNILDLVDSPSSSTRESALVYLGNLPSSQKGLADFSPKLLASALNDPDSHNRELAAKALFSLGDETSKQELKERRNDQ